MPVRGVHALDERGAHWAPWAKGGGDAYEDRGVLRDAAALDAMDRAVAHTPRREPHGWAAQVAAGGTAGFYRARLGVPLPAASRAAWFSKPVGVSYDELLATVAPHVREGESVLWMRRLVLGPTPEFCTPNPGPRGGPRARSDAGARLARRDARSESTAAGGSNSGQSAVLQQPA